MNGPKLYIEQFGKIDGGEELEDGEERAENKDDLRFVASSR